VTVLLEEASVMTAECFYNRYRHEIARLPPDVSADLAPFMVACVSH
jgi:hypothetical protein